MSDIQLSRNQQLQDKNSIIVYSGGYMRVFRAKYGSQFEFTGIIGRVQIVQFQKKDIESVTPPGLQKTYFCLSLTLNGVLLWNYAIPQIGEFGMARPAPDLLIFDGFNQQFMLQAESDTEMNDLCKQISIFIGIESGKYRDAFDIETNFKDNIYYSMNNKQDRLSGLNIQTKKLSEGILKNDDNSNVYDIEFQTTINTLQSTQKHQVMENIRRGLSDLGSTASGSAEQYLCLLAVSQQLHRNEFAADNEVQAIITVALRAFQPPVRPPAQIRAMKLVMQLLQRFPGSLDGDGNNIRNVFPQCSHYNTTTGTKVDGKNQNQIIIAIIHAIIASLRGAASPAGQSECIISENSKDPIAFSGFQVLLVNDELVFYAAEVISTIFRTQRHINTSSITMELNQLFNILLSLCIYISVELNAHSEAAVDDNFMLTVNENERDGNMHIQIKKADISENQYFKHKNKNMTQQALINAMYAILMAVDGPQANITGNKQGPYFNMQQNNLTQYNNDTREMFKFPENNAQELQQFMQFIASKLDFEVCVYLHAFSNNKMQEYYKENNFLTNLISILGVVGQIFNGNLENQQTFKHFIQFTLYEKYNQAFKHFLQLLKVMGSGNMFFLDSYTVQGFEVRQVKNSIQLHKEIVFAFVSCVKSINIFFTKMVLYVQKKSSTLTHLINQISWHLQDLQIINANIIQKCIFCLNTIQYSAFTDITNDKRFQQMIQNIINTHNHTIQIIPDTQMSKQYVKIISQTITICYEVIESDNQQFIKLGYNHEEIQQINSFSYNILILFISQLAQKVMSIIQLNNKQQTALCLKYFYQYSITNVIYNCLKISDEGTYKKYASQDENYDMLKKFKENLVTLCQLLILNNFKNYEYLKQQNMENQEQEVQNLLDIFPKLISIQFSNISQTNMSAVIEEIEIYQSIRKNYLQQYLVNNSMSNKLIQGISNFCTELLSNINNQLDIEQDQSKVKGNYILIPHMISCFVYQMKDLINLNSPQLNIIQYLQQQLDPFKICEFNINILNFAIHNNDQQIQQLVLSSLEIFISYFQLNSNLKMFCQFMYIQIQKNNPWTQRLFTYFIKYLEEYKKIPSETYTQISVNISIILTKITSILELDMFNKQSILFLQTHYQINILEDEITAQKLCQIFIDNDESVINTEIESFSINHQIMNNMDNVNDYYNIEKRLQIITILIESNGPSTMNNMILSLYLIVWRLMNVISYSPNAKQISETQLLQYYVTESFVTHLFNIMQQIKWGEQDINVAVGNALLIIKIITYLYEINPKFLCVYSHIHQQIGKTIQSLQSADQYLTGPTKKQIDNAIIHLFKLLNNIISQYAAESHNKQIDKFVVQSSVKLIKQLIDDMYKNQNARAMNIYVNYYLLQTIQNSYTFVDNTQYTQLLLQNPMMVSNIIRIIQEKIGRLKQQEDNSQIAIIKNIMMFIIQILRNIISGCNYESISSQGSAYQLQTSGTTEIRQSIMMFENMLQINLQQADACIISFFEKYFIFNLNIYKWYQYSEINSKFNQIIDVMCIIFKTSNQLVKQYVNVFSPRMVELFLFILYTTFNPSDSSYSLQVNINQESNEIQKAIVQMIKKTYEKAVKKQDAFLHLQIVQCKLTDFIFEYLHRVDLYNIENDDVLTTLLIRCLFAGLQYNYDILLEPSVIYLEQKSIANAFLLIKNISEMVIKQLSKSEQKISAIANVQLQSTIKTICDSLELYQELQQKDLSPKFLDITNTVVKVSELQENSVKAQILQQQMYTYLSIIGTLLQNHENTESFIKHNQWLFIMNRVLTPSKADNKLSHEIVETCTDIIKKIINDRTVDIIILDNTVYKNNSIILLILNYFKLITDGTIKNIAIEIPCINNMLIVLEKILTLNTESFNKRIRAIKPLQQNLYSAIKQIIAYPNLNKCANKAAGILEIIKIM